MTNQKEESQTPERIIDSLAARAKRAEAIADDYCINVLRVLCPASTHPDTWTQANLDDQYISEAVAYLGTRGLPTKHPEQPNLIRWGN